MAIISPSVRKIALERLMDMGLKVSFSKHCEEKDLFDSSSVKSRLSDIHEAFSDSNVKAILTTIGGYNSIHLLKGLDFELIRKNPKILCGYSDITTLQNAIFAKTGLVTYSGPHFSTFGSLKGIEYIIEYFKKCLFEEGEISLEPSSFWSDDEWYLDQEKRTFMLNPGYEMIQPGVALGTVIGFNIGSFSLLQGTDFMPSFKDIILFLEDNYPMTIEVLDRHIQSLILQKDFQFVKGIVFGRFQIESKITMDQIKEIVSSKEELKKLPILANADFGHTLPIFTLPIGGEIKLDSNPAKVKLSLLKK